MAAIPFDLGPHVTIFVEQQADVEGRPAHLVLDTGAAGPYAAYLDEAFARSLGLEVGPEFSPYAKPGALKYRLAHVKSLTVGPVILHDAVVAVTPVLQRLSATTHRQVDGLIGYTFLKDRVVSIDYGARRLDLQAADGPADLAISFRLGSKSPLTVVEARLNGRGPFSMMLDTGNDRTTLSPKVAREAGVTTRGVAVTSSPQGNFVVRRGSVDIQFGPIRRTAEPVAVSDIVAEDGRDAGIDLDGELGADLLTGSVLTLDYRTQQLWITPSSATPTP